jgi:Apea-like HEPN
LVPAKKGGITDAVIDASYLNENNLWARVFQSFYDQKPYKRFKGMWSRFFGVMAHDGYWEHGIFSCVSLLEAYCSGYCRDFDESLPEEVFNALVKSYKSLIDEHKNKSDNLSPAIFDGLKGLLGNSRNTKYPTFNMKFDKLIEDTPREIIESIGITKDDFKHIKEIRDKVAHAGTPRTRDQRDITHEETIKSKLMVLIMYYLYKDLGFNKNDFINFISKRFNKILRSACLNTERIDYFSDKVPFYEVDTASFNSVKETKGHQLIFKYDHKSKSLIFDEATTHTIKNSWPNSPTGHTNLEHFVYDSVSERDECKTIGYLNHFYVTCGKQNKEIWGACVINPNEEIYKLCRVYPHKS